MELPLSRGLVAIVDDDVGPEVVGHKWYAIKTRGGKMYAARKQQNHGKRVLVLMHRVIAQAERGEEVDHKNGNTLDNRSHNLRRCSRSQNMMNYTKAARTSSRFIGVSSRSKWNKTNPWVAYIKKNGKTTIIGYFADEIEAAKARDNVAREMFGQFARLNFGDDI